MKILTLVFFISVSYIGSAFSQMLNVSIFNEMKIVSFSFIPQNTDYDLVVDSTAIMRITKETTLNIARLKDSVVVRSGDKKIGTFKYFMLSSRVSTGYFKIKPVSPSFDARYYDDNLYVFVNQGKLIMSNRVEMDNYIAGVVQSEGGVKATIEYYKLQAIICRTWVLQNINKHLTEYFNVCDNTHCQSYFGKCITNSDIINAARMTSGLVIVDTTLSLISATFHSNCGGETAFSEDVWTKPRTYLKSVPDTFCRNSLNARWEKTIPLDKWKKYLVLNGFKLSDTANVSDYFNSVLPHRKMYYKLNNDSIPLTKIRADMNLKSAWFSVVQSGDTISLKGRGYGHGVGLCQEGAMKMAQNGYKYMDIIKYYYKNIYIVSTRALQFGNGGK